MNAIKMLDDAVCVVMKRNDAYGDPAASLSAIAARWSLTLGQTITPTQVALCMIDLKLARLAHDPKQRDSIIDVIGYAALLPEVTK